MLFGRVEWVRKSAEELVLPGLAPPCPPRGCGPPDERTFGVASAALGYTRQFAAGPFLAGLGGRFSVNFVPAALENAYGSRTPTGFALFLQLRPQPMAMGAHGMPDMNPDMPGAAVHHGVAVDTGVVGPHVATAPPATETAHAGMAGMEHMRMPMAAKRDTARAGMAGMEPMRMKTPAKRDTARAGMAGMEPMRMKKPAKRDTAHAGMAGMEPMRAPPSARLSARDVRGALEAAGVRPGSASTVRQPFWSVATRAFELPDARTRGAAVHVNVYASAEALRADLAAARRRAMPMWIAPPHFYVAGNALIVLLADPTLDLDLMRRVERAVRSLDGRKVAGPGGGR